MRSLILALAVATATPIVSAQHPTVIVSNIPGDPTSFVPGLPGVTFEVSGGTGTFLRPHGSPGGNWIMNAILETATGVDDEVLLVNGVGVLREGDPAPWAATGTLGPFPEKLAINDAGQYAFAHQLGGVGLNGCVVKFDGAQFVVVAQHDVAIPAMPGAIYDITNYSTSMTEVGGVWFEARFIDGAGLSSTNDAVLLADDGQTLIAQKGVTVPGGQAGGAADSISFFYTDSLSITPDGQHVLWQSLLASPFGMDEVVVYDGAVVLQEGTVIPGSGFAEPIDSNGLFATSLDAAGNWFVHGDNDQTNVDWVVRNGQVMAAVGQPIVPGSAELWDDNTFGRCFFALVGNGNGDYVIGGETTESDFLRDAVLVLNGTDVVLREGDPIDLDGDGQLDDDLFIAGFDEYELFLADDCELILTVSTRNAAGTQFASAVVRVDLDCDDCGAVTPYGAGCAGTGGFVPSLDVTGCAAPGGSIILAIDHALGGASALLFLGGAQGSFPVGGGCSLLLAPSPVVVSLPLGGSGPGNGNVAVPATVPAYSGPLDLYLQAFVVDVTAPFGFSATQGLQVGLP